MSIEKLSASGIKKYRECPKQFWYKYLSDVEPPDAEEPKHFKAGNAVHESIENVLREHGALDDEDIILELLEEEEEEIGYDHESDDKVDNCLKMAAKYISKYVVSIRCIEEEWNMEYSKINFKGYADLVADIKDDGDILENVIVDWKTGREQKTWQEHIQGGVYVEMFHDKFNEWPDGVEFVYLNQESKSRNRRIEDGTVVWNDRKNDWWDEIEGTINKILHADNTDEWEAKPESSKCHFCDYALACSDYVGFEELTPVEIELGL